MRALSDDCTRRKGYISSLGEVSTMDVPFHCVVVYLIDPFTPVSDNGSRCVLTIVDFAKYPEAVAHPRNQTERVTDALLDVFKGWFSNRYFMWQVSQVCCFLIL